MKILCSSFFICYFLIIQGQDFKTDPAIRADSVFICGEIRELNVKPTVVVFHVTDYVLGRQVPHYAMVDSSGKFKINLFLRHTHEIYWQLGEGQHHLLLAEPGDSLAITVGNKGISFTGNNARACEDIHNMRTPDEWLAYYFQREKGYDLEPEEYLNFRKKYYELDQRFLDDYCAERDCSGLFRKWYLSNIRVNYFVDLMNFSWKSLNYGFGTGVRLAPERKEKYNASFWEDIQPDDSSYFLSSKYMTLLNNMSWKYLRAREGVKEGQVAKLNLLIDLSSRRMSTEVTGEAAVEMRAIKSLLAKVEGDQVPDSTELKSLWKISEQYNQQLQNGMERWNIGRVVHNLSQIPDTTSRDLLLAHRFFQAMQTTGQIDYYYEILLPLIRNPAYKKVITDEYLKNRKADTLIHAQNGVRPVYPDYNKSADQILAHIVRNNRNKVILIDIWATWCSPCIEHFTKLERIRAALPPDSISYVFLCAQSPFDTWKKQISRHNVQGQHYFLSEIQYDEFRKKFNLKAFPTYFVVDSKKRIHKNIPFADEMAFIDRIKLINKKSD